jgi:hypothetical protein
MIYLKYYEALKGKLLSKLDKSEPYIGMRLISDSGKEYKIRGFNDRDGIRWESDDISKGVWSKSKFEEYIKDGRLKIML